MMRRAVLMLLSALLLAAPLRAADEHARPAEALGSRDFIAFWAGARVFLQGGNPYDGQQLLPLQQQAAPARRAPQFFLNPPWALPLLAPLAHAPFDAARRVWLCLNAAMAVLVLIPLRLIYGAPRAPAPRAICALLCFFPTLMALQYGQLSLLIGLSAFASFAALQRRKDALAGILLLPALLKPHLLHLVLVALVLRGVRERRVRFIASLAAGAVVIGLLPLAWNRDIYRLWLGADFSPTAWRTSSLPTLLRGLLPSGAAATWPVAAVPLLAELLYALQFFFGRLRIDWGNAYPALVCLSLLTAPYAWPFDYSILAPVQAALAGWPPPQRSPAARRLLAAALLLNQLVFLMLAANVESLEHFVYFPLCVYLIWGFSRPVRR